jgi:hypothetical protein
MTAGSQRLGKFGGAQDHNQFFAHRTVGGGRALTQYDVQTTGKIRPKNYNE